MLALKTDPELFRATGLSPLALRVLEKRYLLRNFSGRVSETPDEMFHRVASAVARSEQKKLQH